LAGAAESRLSADHNGSQYPSFHGPFFCLTAILHAVVLRNKTITEKHKYQTSNLTSVRLLAIPKTWQIPIPIPAQAHSAVKVPLPIPSTFISSSLTSRIGKVIGLVREKGEWNPNKWGLHLESKCLDNPKTAALPDPPWKAGPGKGKKGGKGKKKKKKGASCAVM
jgi:hypothetical protein